MPYRTIYIYRGRDANDIYIYRGRDANGPIVRGERAKSKKWRGVSSDRKSSGPKIRTSTHLSVLVHLLRQYFEMEAGRGKRILNTISPDDDDSKSEVSGGETEYEVEVESDDDDQLPTNYVEGDDDYSGDSNHSSDEWETIEGDDDDDYCVDSASEEEEVSDCGSGDFGDDDDDDTLCNRVVQFLRGKGKLEKLTLKEYKAYLRKHGLKISGTKALCLQRIQEHWSSDRCEPIKGDGDGRYCGDCPSKEKEKYDCGNGDDILYSRVVQFLQEKKDLGKLSLKEYKAYLHKHSLRLSGTKAICLQRIQEHWRVKDGSGEALYPSSSFIVNCTGDVCKGDVVLFTQKVYANFDKVTRNGELLGRRIVAGRVVKESYGVAKQQHTFTVEVFWSKGMKKLSPLSQLLIKGRNLYRFRTRRQLWENEVERSKALAEKHKRGAAARQKMAMRKQTRPTDIEKHKRGAAARHKMAMTKQTSSTDRVNIAYATQEKGKNKVRCFRCKEYDHVARNCPKNRAQCFSCDEYGHFTRNCPKKYCNYCKKEGHIMKDCPVRLQKYRSQASQAAVRPSSFGTSSRPAQCFSCDEYGHFTRNCPKKYCNYCKIEGHIMKDCPVRLQKYRSQASQAAVRPSSFDTTSRVGSEAPILAPTTVQQMLVPSFTTLSLEGLGVRGKE